MQQAYQAVLEAIPRVNGHVYRTPLQRALWLESGSTRVYLKLESEQVTGSFKARGAINKVFSLSPDELSRSIVTASTGNHALAVTHAVLSLNKSHNPPVQFQIFLPENASSAKVEHLQALGAPLSFVAGDCLVAEETAVKLASSTNAVYVSPYNDLQIIGGQGTCGAEIMEQLKKDSQEETLDAVFIPVGGGGLIAGVASYIKSVSPNTRVIGCCPRNDAHMARSVAVGELIEGEGYLENGGETLSEGTAGAVQRGSVTFEICKQVVDEWVELTEEEIGMAVVDVLDKHHKAVEGAAGLGVAAFKKMQKKLEGKVVAIVLCGGNVKAQMLKDLLNKFY